MKSGIRVDILAYDHADVVSGPIAWSQRMPSILRSLGFEVRLLLYYWGSAEAGAIYNAASKSGIRCEAVSFGSTADNVSWLLGKISEDRPEVFVANHVLPGWLVAGVLTSCGVPTVGVLRSDDKYYHALIDNFLRGKQEYRPAAVVSVSQFLTNTVRTILPDGITETICSGAIPPTKVACWSKPFRLVYSGRFADEQKRISFVAEAMIRACRQIEGVEGLLIGDGPEFSAIRDRVNDAAVAIRMTGRLAADEAKELLAEAHAMILFSEYEGLPTTLIEGMMAGAVPICTEMRSGLAELVIPGSTGFLVRDIDEFLSVVRKLVSDKDMWESYSRSAREHVTVEFSIEASAVKWSQILRRVAAEAKPARVIPSTPELCPPDIRFSPEDDRMRLPRNASAENPWSLRRVVRSISRALKLR